VATTKTYKPAADGDNGLWSDSGYFRPLGLPDDTQLYFGYGNPYTYYNTYHAFFRFPSVDVPVGAVINSAKITLNAHASNSTDDCNIKIYGTDADNPAAPTNADECKALTLTTAYSLWSNIADIVADTNYDTPDITTVIQEIVNRSGWASGNALIVLFKDNGSVPGELAYNQANRNAHTHKQGLDVCPILTITYHTQWGHKINTVSTPAKVYGVANASDNFKVNKINTVAR
jgi:hypothetical protein